MHSRIFELSDAPIPADERYSYVDLPEWFFNTIADYADDIPDDKRQGEIDCLVGSFRGLCTRDEDGITIAPELMETHFKPN